MQNLSIGDDFIFNEIKSSINSLELDEFKGNLDSITHDGVEANSAGVYTGVTPLSGDGGSGATFDIEVQSASPSGFFVTNVTINDPGKNYHVSDQIIIDFSSFDGFSDLTITVNSVTSNPVLYTDTNCVIARDGDNNNYISYLVNPEFIGDVNEYLKSNPQLKDVYDKKMGEKFDKVFNEKSLKSFLSDSSLRSIVSVKLFLLINNRFI